LLLLMRGSFFLKELWVTRSNRICSHNRESPRRWRQGDEPGPRQTLKASPPPVRPTPFLQSLPVS
jgi:hypothetical protein